MPETSRRGLLGHIVALTGAAAISPKALGAESPPAEGAPPASPPTAGGVEVPLRTTINGQTLSVSVGEEESALALVRERLGLTGTKLSCGLGVCGACTIEVDGATASACLTPAAHLEGRVVRTIEGMGDGAHPVQQGMLRLDALQCGYCTPGFAVEGIAFYEKWTKEHGKTRPPEHVLAEALAGHVCRCGAQSALREALGAACAGEVGDGAWPRSEGLEKITGRAKYTVDKTFPGMLHAKVLRSPVAHGVVSELDLEPARQIPGVKAVHAVLQVGAPLYYEGQEIAAVAAVDEATARAALQAIRLGILPQPVVVDRAAALAPNATVLFPEGEGSFGNASEGPVFGGKWSGNLRGPTRMDIKADPKEALRGIAASTSKVQVSVQIQAQIHSALEPHACVARWLDGGLECHISTQAVWDLAQDLAERFELEPSRVAVFAEHVGGGFGAKATLQKETVLAAELARLAGAPVRLALERWEELLVGGFRPAADVDVELAADAEGGIAGLKARCYSMNGAAVGGSVGPLMKLVYRTKSKDIEDWDVITNGAPGKPFRGPGGPAAFFGLESAVDALAELRGEDPLALRKRWDPNPIRQRLFAQVEQLPLWRDREARRGQGRVVRGVGMASSAWFYFFSKGASVELTGRQDGRFVARIACQDMGQGSRSVIHWALADALGVDRAAVEVELGDSRLPRGPMSGGSRTTPSVVPAATDAARELMELLLEAAEDGFEIKDAKVVPGGVAHQGGTLKWSEILARCGERSVMGRRRRDDDGAYFATEDIGLGKAWPGAVQVAQVAVDTVTGRVAVEQVWLGMGVGRIHAPPIALSQCRGAVVQGVSYALFEERRVDPRTGLQLTHNLEDYRIIGVGDTPSIEVHFDPEPLPGVREGGVGLAELATVGVPAAVANALSHALRRRVTRLPANPQNVLELIRQ